MKKLLVLFLLAAATLVTVPDVRGKVYIDLEAPSIEKLPLAVQRFQYTGSPPSGDDRERVREIGVTLQSTLKADLKFSGLFRLLDEEAFLEDPSAGLRASETNFRDWRIIGADTLIKAGYRIEGGRLVVEVRFFDAVREELVFAKRYIGRPESPRRLIHYFSDQLYEELTGRRGIFSTRILFVSAKSGNKEVYVCDYDGENTVQITRNGSINLSPKWGPDGKTIYYTSYKGGYPSTYEIDLVTGRERKVSSKPGINIGARPSPDGSTLALTLSVDRSPELYLLELRSGSYRRLTNNYGIDVSPAWSPEGVRLAYVSDRSGNPHIFMLDLSTGNRKRLTYNGKYNASPAWSPDGKLIAFARSDSGRFNVWTMRPEGTGLVQLTYEEDNRSPSWSPDSRFIAFSRSRGGISYLYIMQADGSGLVKIDTGVGGETSPAWSPYLR